MINRQIVLRHRPVGVPVASDFALIESPLPECRDDHLVVRVDYLGLEPSARPRMDASSPYSVPVALGEPIPSTGVGQVIASRASGFVPGDWVFVHSGWQRYAASSASAARKIDPGRAPLPKWLSLLGLSAFTAYVGMTVLAPPRPGETVVVSAASGATGAIAGQIARLHGARAVGIVGGPEKCLYVESLGFDAGVDYKAKDFAAQLDAACPHGIDVNFENVGGDVLGAVFARMNPHGRVLLCGLISQYNAIDDARGPNLWRAVYNAIRIEGFLASRHWDRIPAFIDEALAWAEAGQLQQREHIVEGLEQAPAAFRDLLGGRHLGKAIVKLTD
jgi:NADPH-dependent curcumin reductase